MPTTTLASFRFPRRLAETPRESFVAQELVDFLKVDASYFAKSFRKKFKPIKAAAGADDMLTGDPAGVEALDVVSTSRSAPDLLAATAALADFHQFIVRENVDRWEAIAPDFALWRDFPGAYALWTAKIVTSPLQACGVDQTARLRVVRQSVADERARDAVAHALDLLPQVRLDEEDMIVSYIARKSRRPALADRR